jgi:integrase
VRQPRRRALQLQADVTLSIEVSASRPPRFRLGQRLQANVWHNRDRRRIRKTCKGTMRAPTPVTLTQAAEEFLEGARTGAIRTRNGTPYKPSTLRGLTTNLRKHILPTLGDRRLSDIRRVDLQDLAEQLLINYPPNSVWNIIGSVWPIFDRAVYREQLAVNPKKGLRLPMPDRAPRQIMSRAEALALIEAAPEEDRVLWATAFYSGLRIGELVGLRWQDVDLADGWIYVRRGWDQSDGEITPKSESGRRRVPIVGALREHLIAHKLRTGGRGHVFNAKTRLGAIDRKSTQRRADKAWKAAGLQRVTYHAFRHCFASMMIEAGINAKTLCTYMGHASITVTFDTYGHLMPGSEEQFVAMADAYHAQPLPRDNRATISG